MALGSSVILVSKSWRVGYRDGLCLAFRGVTLQFLLVLEASQHVYLNLTWPEFLKSTQMVAVTPKNTANSR